MRGKGAGGAERATAAADRPDAEAGGARGGEDTMTAAGGDRGAALRPSPGSPDARTLARRQTAPHKSGVPCGAAWMLRRGDAMRTTGPGTCCLVGVPVPARRPPLAGRGPRQGRGPQEWVPTRARRTPLAGPWPRWPRPSRRGRDLTKSGPAPPAGPSTSYTRRCGRGRGQKIPCSGP